MYNFNITNPTQTDVSADYLLGKAKNVTVSGDNTGTPWNAFVANNLLFGPLSAIMSEAGIAPNGSEEKVGQSQVLDALKVLIGKYAHSTGERNAVGAHDDIYTRNFKTVADLRAQTDSSGLTINLASLSSNKVFWRGYYSESDGGGNWGIVKTGNSTSLVDDSYSIFVIVNNTVNGVWIEANTTTTCRISVRKAGGKAVAGFDNSAAINAILSKHKSADVYFPPSQNPYEIHSQILIDTIGDGYTDAPTFSGDGMYQSVLDNKSGTALFKLTSGSADEFMYGYGLTRLGIIDSSGSANSMAVDLTGCRFVEFKQVRIDGMGSHGIYGNSTVGDFTDSSSMQFKQVQIENCGGYGVYAESQAGAIQYGWNFKQCRIGNNELGGALLESLVNSDWFNNGIYNNKGFGVRLTKKVGADNPNLVTFRQCEFDTNQGVQLDIVHGIGIKVDQPYLIANLPVGGVAFSKGIAVGDTDTCVIKQASPRINPSLTGLTMIEVSSSANDTVIRDTSYSGYSASNGSMYVNNSSTTIIDDLSDRSIKKSGTYAVTIKNASESVTSSTAGSGYYSKLGNQVSIGLRNLNNIDLSSFAGADIITVSLPFACVTNSAASFCGSCIITSDAGVGIPIPVVSNGGSSVAFKRSGSGAFLTASDLTSGTSGIIELSINYVSENN